MQGVGTENNDMSKVQDGVRSRLPAAMQQAGVRRASALARSTPSNWNHVQGCNVLHIPVCYITA